MLINWGRQSKSCSRDNMNQNNGRPTECTPDVIYRIAELFRRGLFELTIAGLVGISVSSLKNWRKWGEDGREPYLTYLTTVQKAEAEWEAESVSDIEKASQDKFDELDKLLRKGEWQARAWLLERRYQTRYGRYNTRVKVDQPIDDSLTDAERLTKLANNVIDQAMTGEMPVEAANLLINAIDNRRKLIETCDHEQRIKATEQALKERTI